MSEATVAAGLAKRLLESAASKGVGRKAIVERSGVERVDLEEPDDRVPLSKYVALMGTAQRLSNDPALALHFGDSPFAETGIGCSIGDYAENGSQALALWNRYANLNFDVDCEGGGERFLLSRNNRQ